MINSVLKALDIIDLFSPQEPSLSLAEISRRLEIPKSTAHNLLNTLLSRGFIERTNGDDYALGTAIIRVSHAVRVNVELRDRAAQLLRQLADNVHQSVYLTCLDGDYALYIYAVESSRRLLARTAIGDRVFLHCTSVGKAMLAFLPESELDGIIARAGLARYTANTITDPTALHQELVRTRARGYALDQEEHELGTFCIGAPILDQRGLVVGACSVSGTDRAVIGERLPELSTLVLTAAQDISRTMGYVPARLSMLAGQVASLHDLAGVPLLRPG